MIRIALPNKGRLADRTLALLETGGLKAEFRAERALTASLGDDFQAIFVRASDIPGLVSDGAAELGVTGADLVAESGLDIPELLDLGFGRCRLIVAVPEESPIRDARDVSAEPRGPGRGRAERSEGGARGVAPPLPRIATSFPHLARTFFQGLDIPISIASVSGAVEIAPHLGVADMIVDLTSTGSTLRVNGLREIATIMESSARLIGNASSVSAPGTRRSIDELIAALESVLRAERKRYLMANVPRDRLDEVRQILPGISGPTIVDVMDRGRWVAAHAVVDADDVYRTIAALKEIEAEGILVTRIERLMP